MCDTIHYNEMILINQNLLVLEFDSFDSPHSDSYESI